MHRAPAIIFLTVLFAVAIITVVTNTKDSLTNYKLAKENQGTKVLLTGDIMLGRSVNVRSLSQNNPRYPFEKVYERLEDADIVFSNLESPFVDNCPKTETGMIFCSDPKMVDGLNYAGIDIVNISNNHISNYGARGIEKTKSVLEENGVIWVAGKDYEIIEKNGIKFGFLGFDLVDKVLTKGQLSLVEGADHVVDFLIVGVHWGSEYQAKAGKTQREMARQLVDSGADVIAGHHPHWVQDFEEINGKKVYYSLGNFVFDQMWSENTRRGLAVELTFRGKDMEKEELLPIYMENWAQPEWTNE